MDTKLPFSSTRDLTSQWDPDISTAIPEIGWPAMGNPTTSRLLAGLEQLNRSQWQPPETIASHQLE